ncbi:MAG: hypothetical protein J5752_11485 [Clostridiales bacterium]|nr:hypothetical protein [Clostridiales bacterium]
MKKRLLLLPIFLSIICIFPSCSTILNTSSVSEGTESQILKSKKISIEEINKIKNQDSITWNDFALYEGEDIGSGLFIFRYDVENGGYLLVSGRSMDNDPEKIIFVSSDGKEERIGITTNR